MMASKHHGRLVALTLSAVSLFGWCQIAPAQVEIQVEIKPNAIDALLGQVVIEQRALIDPFGASMNKATLLEGAQLKTDSGSQEIVTQAEQFVAQGRYDLATILWQRVIDESGDQVFTRDDWTEKTLQNQYRKYRSVAGDIEATLAKLPPEGLAAYRLKADGEARALMNSADGKGRESALAEVVRRFFLSKLGDDAAFELACLKLDRGEFLPAARLLAKIATEYPNPTVRLGEIQLRLAAVNARVGEVEQAKEILAGIKKQPIPPVPVAVIRLVEEDIENVADQRGGTSGRIGAWTLPQGGPSRSGLMQAPPKFGAAGAVKAWQQGYTLTLPAGADWDAIAAGQDEIAKKEGEDGIDDGARLLEDPFRELNTRKQPTKKPATDEEIVAKWKQHGWKPVGQVLVRGGKIYFKTHDRIVCCDAATGDLNWFGGGNEYPVDKAALQMAQFRARYSSSGLGNANGPSGEREMLSFSDMLNQSMSLVGDKLLVVQGKAFFEDGELDEAGLQEEINQFQRIGRFGGQDQASNGRTRENRLFAYHAHNGRLQWMLDSSKLLPESKRKMAFAGSAVPYGSLVVVPVFEATSLWLFGLNPDNGEVLWKSFLADEPAGQTNSNSPVRVAIDGGEAYVATGAGVIASVDAISGTLNWAVAYPRTSLAPDSQSTRRNLRGMPSAQLDGWKEDTIIPSGNAIVFAASDFNHLAALDRRTGNLLWESARRPIEGEPESDYVLGIADGKVCVAGRQIVRAYRLKGGRLLWERRLEKPSTARGMVTNNGIYVPMEKSILHLSLEDGVPVETIEVAGAEDALPLGNLYSDGDRIFSAGFREITSLRALAEGEEPPKPAMKPEEDQVEAAKPEEPGSVTHEVLAAEARKLIADAFAQLEKVQDAAGAEKAGKGFEQAGDKLGAIARIMKEKGAPDEDTRKRLEALFAKEAKVNGERFNESLGRILTLEGAVGNVLEKVVGMNRKAEGLPILKQYGIDLELRPDGGE